MYLCGFRLKMCRECALVTLDRVRILAELSQNLICAFGIQRVILGSSTERVKCKSVSEVIRTRPMNDKLIETLDLILCSVTIPAREHQMHFRLLF